MIWFFFFSSPLQIHKHMSSEQLQSIFHVDRQELVPHYEVIRLTHHGTSHHSISKRSINHQSKNQFVDNIQKLNSQHHVKKDLSKSAYYSDLKRASNQQLSNSNNSNNKNFFINKSQIKKNSFSNKDEKEWKLAEQPQQQQPQQEQNVHKFDENIQDVIEADEPETTQFSQHAEQKHPKIDLSNIKEHNVSLNVFGEVYNLTLRPTDGLFKNGPQSLEMWNVNTNPNATQGLQYDQIKEVSSIFLQVFPFLLKQFH